MRFDTVTIVGVGLIGGSVGKAIKSRGLAREVIGVGRDRISLDKAIEVGAIDGFEPTIAEGVLNSDLVIVCTPVNLIAAQVIEAAKHCPAHGIITDAGSTKGTIVAAIEAAEFPQGVQYIGSHPIAGSARSGPEAADADLFENRTTVVTPTEQSTESGLIFIEEFWRSLGSRTIRLDADKHDQMLAWTSHLPHIVAGILAGVVPEEARIFAGSGLRDTTRIAAGEPSIWLPIIEQNRGSILACLEAMQLQIRSFRHLLGLRDFEAIEQLLHHGKKGRDALGN